MAAGERVILAVAGNELAARAGQPLMIVLTGPDVDRGIDLLVIDGTVRFA